MGDLSWNNTHMGKHSELVNGQVVQCPKQGPRYRISRHAEPDIIVVADRITPLIDRETFRRAGEALVRNRKATSPKSHDESRHIFTHMIVCANCGAFMTGSTNKTGEKVYICSSYDRHRLAGCTGRNTVREAPLRDFIIGALRKDWLNPDKLAELEAEMRRQLTLACESGEAETIGCRLAEIEKDIERADFNMARARSQEALDGIARAVAEWKQERSQLSARLKEIESGDQEIGTVIEEARRQLWQLTEALDSADPSLVRATLREVVSKVELCFSSRRAGKLTRSQFERGIIYVRPGVELPILGPSVWRTIPR
jgi:hypothetical protein